MIAFISRLEKYILKNRKSLKKYEFK